MKRRTRVSRMRSTEPTVLSHQKLLLIGGILLLAVLLLLYFIFFTNLFRGNDHLLALDITENTIVCTADGSSIYYWKVLPCIGSIRPAIRFGLPNILPVK